MRVPDRDAALAALRPRLRAGDVVLVKASRGIELDKLVEELVTELRGSIDGLDSSTRSPNRASSGDFPQSV